MYNNRDWESLKSNLKKYQRRWGMTEKVLGKTGTTIKAPEMIYKAIVYTVLLYGREIWVVRDVMLKVIEGFCHMIAIWIVGMNARKGNSG